MVGVVWEALTEMPWASCALLSVFMLYGLGKVNKGPHTSSASARPLSASSAQ